MKLRSLVTILAAALCAAFAPPPVLRPVESAAKEIAGLEFSVVTQAQWKAANLSGASVVLQLRMKSVSKAAILFPTFDSISPVLTGPDGKTVALGGGRDGTIITPSILLPPGKEFSHPLAARLVIVKTTKGSHIDLEIQDGTGTIFTAGMTPGTYKIGFQLRPANPEVEKNGGHEAPMWAASGETNQAEFTVAPLPEPAK